MVALNYYTPNTASFLHGHLRSLIDPQIILPLQQTLHLSAHVPTCFRSTASVNSRPKPKCVCGEIHRQTGISKSQENTSTSFTTPHLTTLHYTAAHCTTLHCTPNHTAPHATTHHTVAHHTAPCHTMPVLTMAMSSRIMPKKVALSVSISLTLCDTC